MNPYRIFVILLILAALVPAGGMASAKSTATYPVVDTGQNDCYDNQTRIACPGAGRSYYGQDAQYEGNQATYRDNGDGTVTDLVTGLMWQKGFTRSGFSEAEELAEKATTGGHTDWRVPTIKELYSLIDFSGSQGRGRPESAVPPGDAAPFIDTDFFAFEYPDSGRYIDVQFISSTQYVSMVMNGQKAFFGVNFADGRIKGYPQMGGRGNRKWHLRLIRGTADYGRNQFVDNRDGTISDNATGLMWSKYDSGHTTFARWIDRFGGDDGSLSWQDALAFANAMKFAGHDDWRLPNAKELHTIVDYSRSPDTTGSPAIDPLFQTTAITNEAGLVGFPLFLVFHFF